MNLNFLLGAGGGGVQMPDPVAEMARGYSLSNLARQNRAGRDEEQDKARMRQAQIDAAQGLALAQSQGWDSAIQQTMQKNPDAGSLLLKLRKEDEGASVEREVKRSTATKNYADADKTTTDSLAKAANDIGNVAFQEAKAPNRLSLQRVQSVAKFYGKDLPPFAGDPNDPQAVSGYLQQLGAQAYDIKDRVTAEMTAARDAETGRHNMAGEGHQAASLAETGRHNRSQEGIGYGNLGVAKERLTMDREAKTAGADQWVNDMPGNRQVNKATAETRPFTEGGVPVAQKADAKRTQQATQALKVIEQAETLIDDATGSYAGAAVDMGARVFGKSTGGANATAKLQALEGALMMAQPRMEGPQSNLDVQLYRQMAARIGDPTVPREQKKAALEEIKTLHERYSGSRGATGDFGDPAPAANAVPARPKVGEKRDGYIYKGGDPANPKSWGKL